ncbi:MAG: M43 family zinc metalloprotease [Cytophagales bacterium]
MADKILKARNPTYKNIIEQPLTIKNRFSNARMSTVHADTLTIPIIVHVVHNGDAVGTNENISQAQVNSQIEVLNEDFQRKVGTLGFNSNPVGAGMPVKFVLAAIDTNGNALAEPGLNRVDGKKGSWDGMEDIEEILKPTTQFDPKRYLNIWVVTFGGGMSSQLGYAQFPDLSSLSGIDATNNVASTDGLVIRFNAFGRVGNLKSPYNKGRTLTHEMGHFFGLLHIWGEDDSNIDCSNDDGCADTPKTKTPFYGCPPNANSCTPNVLAMKENYLDYTNDACMNTFTINQKQRIETVMAVSPRRKELTTSKVHINPNATILRGNILEGDGKIKMYPNPMDDFIIIESRNQIVEVLIFDIFGIVQKTDYQPFEIHNCLKFNTTNLPNGIYLVQIKTSFGLIYKKIMK